MNQSKKVFFILSVLSAAFFNQPSRAYAWFFDWGWGHHRERHEGYSEVVVGGDRYYYNEGTFYTGAPGSYVVVGAPVGAVIYDVPPDSEQVVIDGDVFFRYHDNYYRRDGRGYRVVERPRRHEDEHEHGREERHEEREEHHRDR